MLLPSDLEAQRFITEKEVAALTGLAVGSLRQDRYLRCGFPYHKIGLWLS